LRIWDRRSEDLSEFMWFLLGCLISWTRTLCPWLKILAMRRCHCPL